MARDLSHMPKPLQRILQSEDATIGFFASWLVGVPVLTLAGFYFGTITQRDQIIDLQVPDIQRGAIYALGGALVATAFALWVTFGYVPAKFREEAMEDAAHAHHDSHDAETAH